MPEPGGSARVRIASGAAFLAIAALALSPVSAAAETRPGAAAANGAAKGGGGKLKASIGRTRYGVPHIRAKSFAGVGFGFGYAFAADNLCTIADSYVTVSAERSRYFGPDESWEFSGNGSVNNNLLSDFHYQRVNDSGVIEDLVASPPPDGPLPRIKAGVRGYVAGYNRYLADTGVDNLPDPRCRGADWVRPIRAIDVYRRFHQLGSLATGGVAIEGIAGAKPILDPLAAAAAERRQQKVVDQLESGERSLRPLPIGSNAYGLGADATRNRSGMLLGSPHFPWDGAERLYQMHLTIPGKLDAAGAGLYGVPLVLIGHTRGLAWSHSVASAWRFTPFELTLNPLDPHQYLVDGEVREMVPTTVTVKARTPGGELVDRTRTLYDTEYGPMLTSLLGLPIFPWTPLKAYALGDVNQDNFRYLNHFLRTNLARNVRQYDRIGRRIQGIPWVNSIAADRRGNAYYSMDGAIPNVPDSKATQCAGTIGIPTFTAVGLPVLDGSRSECDWDTDPDAVTDGIFGPSEIPRLIRTDYVHNANDSHWLTNPEAPLTGFERIIGDEATTRSLRTRLGLVMAADRLAGERFNLRSLTKITLGNRQYAGELWRDELVELCQSSPTQPGSSGPVNVSAACPVLAAWDGRDNLGSDGAILFRRFVSNLLGNFQFLPTGTDGGQYVGSQVIWDNQFSAANPVNTPNGLNTANPLVGKALADAITDLQGAGIPLAAPLRDFQYEERGGERIPIHGGPGSLGVFNAINVGWDADEGYPDVGHGTSFITAIKFKRGRCPVKARTFVTYGQSENQASPHAGDYTRAFSRKRWNMVPFCARQLRRDPSLEVTRVSNR